MVLLLAFLVVPVIELWLIIVASRQIGFLNTVGILVLIAVAGSWLIKREGRKVWTRFTSQIDSGRIPSDDIADGVCLLGAGALMLTPGFFTDVIALLLIVPFTRAPLRRLLVRRYSGRAKVVTATHSGPMGGGRRGTVYETTGREAGGEPWDGDRPSDRPLGPGEPG